MTEQEIFDQVAKHLLVQNRRAIEDFSCRYRTAKGLKCSVGFLINDDEYEVFMENNDVLALRNCGLLPDRLIPHIGFLLSLQDVHDYNPPRKWRGALFLVAKKHQLKTDVLEEKYNG